VVIVNKSSWNNEHPLTVGYLIDRWIDSYEIKNTFFRTRIHIYFHTYGSLLD